MLFAGLQIRGDYFFLVSKNICYGPLFEPSRRDSSNDG